MARILVVDDEEPVRTTLDRILALDQHDVSLATDGGQALSLLEREGPFDLLMIDLLMPGKEGMETIREVRTRDRDIAIIAMSGATALGGVDLLPVAMKLGADATLAKPFGVDAVRKIIDDTLGS